LNAGARERFAQPADLDRWLRAAGLGALKGAATQEDVKASQRLREAIYALALARASGALLPDAARLSLNRFARMASMTAQLEPSGEAALAGDAQALLVHLAQLAIALIGDRRAILRQCEGEGCAILFLDHSRKGDRRWCSMSACGNRAKVAKFRSRKAQG